MFAFQFSSLSELLNELLASGHLPVAISDESVLSIRIIKLSSRSPVRSRIFSRVIEVQSKQTIKLTTN